MKINAKFIPQEPYAELTLRRFPTALYKKSKPYHNSIMFPFPPLSYSAVNLP